MRRSLVLITIAVAAMVIAWRQTAKPAIVTPPLTAVVTAHQFGIVGYRDPVGAISPDGSLLAYSEGRFIRVIPIKGGESITLAPGEGQIRHLAWMNRDTIVADDPTPEARWWKYSLDKPGREPLFGENKLSAFLLRNVRQLTFNERYAAGLATANSGTELWVFGSDGSIFSKHPIRGPASYPVFDVDGDGSATYVIEGERASETDRDPRRQAIYGPMVILRAPGGPGISGQVPTERYFASPDDHGMLQLWHRGSGIQPRQLTTFSRDAYAPSVSNDRTVVFKVQSYQTHLADIAEDGGATRQLTTFQSETPSYHPTRPLLAFTYGSWRRVVDDAKYPDIAQDIGVIDLSKPVPAGAAADVIAKSESEDQAMTWSPNGKWIAFHSHREMSDDVWLRPADGTQPDKRITFLGRGAEVGWPRWSPDGKSVLLDGARKSDGRSVIYVIGIDQETGNVTSDIREVKAAGFDGDITHAEWLGGSSYVVGVAKDAPGQHVIISMPIAGGQPTIVHRYASEHDFSGLGVSPDGRYVAFAAPAPNGYFQIFKKSVAADDAPVQLTSDPANKSQPTWSPDGKRIAFTVWNYDATFYSFHAR